MQDWASPWVRCRWGARGCRHVGTRISVQTAVQFWSSGPLGRRLQFLRRSVTTASPAFRASSPHRARRRWKILSGEACKGLEKAVVQHHSRVGPLVECEASWAPSASLETSSAGLTKHSRSERWSHATVCVAHVDKPQVTCASGSVNAHTELSDE